MISIKRGSEYCSVAHAHAALQLDDKLTIEDLDAIANDDNYTKLPESYHVAIKKAVKCALTPEQINVDDISELKDEGYTNAEIQELFAVADLTVMFNTITMSGNVDIDNEFDDVFKHISKKVKSA